jgi:hypothetical protein
MPNDSLNTTVTMPRRTARNPIGTCALCLRLLRLQQSHLLPAALYRCLTNPAVPNERPILVERTITSTTSRQIRQPLLCKDCEHKVNVGGEQSTLRLTWNWDSFPILDVLHRHAPFEVMSTAAAYSGVQAGIDTEKLGYFALSVIWRAAVRRWPTIFGGIAATIDLGNAQEGIRLYLHGDAPFPQNAVVVLTVCTDWTSKPILCFPSYVADSAISYPQLGFHCCGLKFRVSLGADIPTWLREVCCVRGPEHPIFVSDCRERTSRSVVPLMRQSYPARGLT